MSNQIVRQIIAKFWPDRDSAEQSTKFGIDVPEHVQNYFRSVSADLEMGTPSKMSNFQNGLHNFQGNRLILNKDTLHATNG